MLPSFEEVMPPHIEISSKHFDPWWYLKEAPNVFRDDLAFERFPIQRKSPALKA